MYCFALCLCLLPNCTSLLNTTFLPNALSETIWVRHFGKFCPLPVDGYFCFGLSLDFAPSDLASNRTIIRNQKYLGFSLSVGRLTVI